MGVGGSGDETGGAGAGLAAVGGGGDEGVTKGAGGGWAAEVMTGLTAGAGALAAKHLAHVIWQ